MKQITVITIILFTYIGAYGQNTAKKDNFDYIIRQDQGDLNKDGIIDMAIIYMDTVCNTRPLKLEVICSLPNGKYKTYYSSTQLIQAQYPKELNGEYSGNQIPEVYIEEGKLQLEFYINGNSLYDFRFKNEAFELIHYSYRHYDSKNIIEIDFNLVTGIYNKQSEILETAKITEKINKKVLVRPLPKLKTFKPLANELY